MKTEIGCLFAAVAAAGVAAGADVTCSADFGEKVREIRPALHSSGWAPRLYPRRINNDDAVIKSMRFTYTRTHDWALVNSGQRIVDTCRIFPLSHLDAKDPKNYVFAPTDEALRLARNVGLKLCFRLGESIEHTDGVHFNVLVPEDYEKYAEVCAGIVRHYNRGWANGFRWNIEYWNFWEEPDGIDNLWCLPGAEGQDKVAMRTKFVKLFATVMKRLKAEFPEIKFGGPALCWCDLDYFRELVKACQAVGLKPDFISWDCYAADPDAIMADGEKARRMLDGMGCDKTEIVMAEWHYLLSWTGVHGQNATPEQVKAAKYGPAGLNEIDSACFTLATLSKYQFSKYDQAYYYGGGHGGQWGYMDEDKCFNKPYHALVAFGGIVGDHRDLCATTSDAKTVTVLAARSADGARKTLLVTDYRGTGKTITVGVKGVDAACRVEAKVLDHARREWTPVAADWKDGRLALAKTCDGSAAFVVTFGNR